MLKVNEIYHHHNCGLGKPELWLESNVKQGCVTQLNNKTIEDFILENKIKLDDDKVHFVYFNYHPSSGYNTDIQMEFGFPVPYIQKPQGFAFSAFYSETIVFTIDKA